MPSPRKPSRIDRVIGDILREARRLKGLAQREVAKKLGISQQQYRKYETGHSRVTFERWLQLCNLFGIDEQSANARIADAFASSRSRPAGFEESQADYAAPSSRGAKVLRVLDELLRQADVQQRSLNELRELLAGVKFE